MWLKSSPHVHYENTMSENPIKKTYLQLLPLDSSSQIDIFAVYNRVFPQISKWVDQFLNLSSWETDIHAEFNYPDLFRHFYFETKNIQKTVGQHVFGFGFPMVFDITASDTEGELGTPISAPLFIWYLTIRPHPNRGDSWLIGFEEGNPVVINEYLMAHFSQKYNLDLRNSCTEFINTKSPLTKGLEAFSWDLTKKLDFKNTFIPALKECPRESTAHELSKDGALMWSGVLGLLPHQEGSLSEKKMQDADFQNFTWTAEHSHEFAVLPEDAFQRAALRTILRNKITVVEGAHGTGKTHLAINILLNALSNGQKTAVIANDIGSLMQIQDGIIKLGLGHLTYLLKDVYHDKNIFLDALRTNQTGKASGAKEDEFKITLKQARRYLVKSDDSHEALSAPIFGSDRFSDVVGYYLNSQKKAGRELLANHLNASDYEFTKQEYEQLTAAIQKAEILFGNVGTLRHPLSKIHAAIFEDEKSEKGRSFLNLKLTSFVERWKALHHRYISVYDAYAQKLMNHYDSHYSDLVAQVRLLKESYSDYKFQFGDAFESNSFFRLSGLKAASLFSDRSKNVLTAKDEALSQYDELSQIFNGRNHFSHTFLNQSDRKDFKKLQTNVETFELSLKGWRKVLPATVQEELQRLNSKTAQHFDKSLSEEIAILELDLEELLEATNDAKIYADLLSHKMLTLPKRMLFIEDTIEKLEESQLYMRDFDSFYDWQRYWIPLPENGRKLVQSLIKVKPLNWEAAFDSWYFNNTLIAHYQSSTLNNDDLMNQMYDAEEKLHDLIPPQIAHYWNERKKETVRVLKSQNTARMDSSGDGYKFLLGSKNVELAKKKLLNDVVKNRINTLSDIFPVLLMTPQVATQLIESEGKEFDLVIFDNAQNIVADSVVPIVRNTEGVVVMTEYSKLDGTKPKSLVDKVKKHDSAIVKLNYLHRPISETAKRLNQSVFYPDLEVPFRYSSAEQNVSVVHVKGQFLEKTQSNDIEIAEVVRLLEEIHATPFNTFPRIGVVCMNKKQRNALSNKLLHIVQKTLQGWEKVEQLQRNGLGIYSLEELSGLQFDVLVMSGTFNEIEKMELTRPDLRRIINCFTQKLYWVNSIPQSELAAAADDKERETAFLLSNLLFLTENRASKDSKESSEYLKILEKLQSLYTTQKTVVTSSFVNQVVEYLSEFIPPQYIKKNYVIDNHTFPIAILPKEIDKQPTVIRIDGQLIAGKNFSPTWERRILGELEKMGIPVVSIWSYNWWKNANIEAEKLSLEAFGSVN